MLPAVTEHNVEDWAGVVVCCDSRLEYLHCFLTGNDVGVSC